MNKFRTSPLWTKYKNEFEQDKIRFSYGENFNTENDVEKLNYLFFV